MKSTFQPFRSEDFNTVLQGPSSRPDDYFSIASGLPKVMRGYAEIHKLYHAACLGGRRGHRVYLHNNPSDNFSRRILNSIQLDFHADHAITSHQLGIAAHSTSVCIINRTCVEHADGREYFVLAETLDSALKPTVLGPGLVETFGMGPVAMVIHARLDTDGVSCAPIFTSMSFREVAQTLATTALQELKEIPCPSYGYALLCQAIHDRIYSPRAELWEDEARSFGAGRENARSSFQGMSAELLQISAGIRSIKPVGAYLTPKFSVEGQFEGYSESFYVSLIRNARTGQLRGEAF